MCLAQGHNAVTPVRLKPAAPLSRVKHSTTVLPSTQIDKTKVFKTISSLMKVNSIAECSPSSILQYI